MDKAILRREFFKLRNKGHSYAACKRLLKSTYEYEVTVRTLKRWVKRFDQPEIWDLQDSSRRPNRIYYKIDPEVESEVIKFRDDTGWGAEKLLPHLLHLNISERSIANIIAKHNRARSSKLKGKRKKWVRWQREHPNSLWQIDHTDEQEKFNCYTLSILDDATRYSLALVQLNSVTTDIVKHILDGLIKKYGKPKQILTDNGSPYGGKSKNSRFDRWCKRNGIQHIRTKPHCPTTNGKVERLFRTMDEELEYCQNDFEKFRMRYNHHRPHSSLNGKTPGQKYNNIIEWI